MIGVPFDQTGGPQQGQPSVAPQPLRPPMPPGHGVPTSASPVMQPGHHQGGPMNVAAPPPYSHRNSGSMPGQPPGPPHGYPPMPPPSPAQRQGSFSGGMPGPNGQYTSRPPLHQQQGPPMGHPGMGHPSQMHRHSMNRPHPPPPAPMGMGMQAPPHDPMRGQSSGHGSRQQPPPQQQQYMNNSSQHAPSGSSGMSGNWQSDRDTPHRREMIQHIVKLLKKDRNSSPESMNRLPQMAKHLEVSLYRNARSFEAYMDMSTLKQRLQQIAVEVSRRARNPNDTSRGSSSGGDDRSSRGTDRSMQQQQRQQQSQYSNSQQQQQPPNGMRGESTSPYMGSNRDNSSRGGGMMDDMNSQMSSSQGGYRQSSSSRSNDQRGGSSSMQQQQRGTSSSSQNRNDPDWKLRIRHKQQRLLLLHHSAKCTETGNCRVTPHCADMKRLWRHMEGCKDNHCRVPHCFSSRAILSHYRKCKDASCPACGPVRETVRKSQSASRGGGGSGGGSGNNSHPSTGPLMNSMRNSAMQQQPQQQAPPQQQQPQQPMVSQQQSEGMSSLAAGSFASSHSGMPPPGSGPSGSSDMQQQYQSSSYRPSSAGGSSSQQQPLYRSDGQANGSSSSGRAPTPSGSSQSNKDAMASLPSAKRPAGSSESEWQKIRHKQQRLLLLRHASRCQHRVGTCPVTPHCASMKKLWEHIAHCKNQQCKMQHCLSSRYVLSHYRRCKNSRCPSCGPVRDSIRRSTEREKNRQQQPGQPAQQSSSSHRPPDSFDAVPSSDSMMGVPPVSSSLSSSSSSKPPQIQQVPSQQQQLPPPQPQQAQSQQQQQQPQPPQPPQPQDTSSSSAQQQYQPPNKRARRMMDGDATSVASSTITAPMSNMTAAGVAPPRKPAQEVAVPAPKQKKEPKPPRGDHSLLDSFTVKQLETHLASLDRKTQLPPTKFKSKCVEILKGLQTHQHGWVFNCPVDPIELGLPDYFDIIKKPMDLGTVQKRLDSGSYHDFKNFTADINLTFDNAMTYNEEGTVVYGMAKELKTKFESDMDKLISQLEQEDRQRRQNDKACTLCGCEKLLFEPPVYFCNGMNCQSQRIRRNSHFYIGGNNQYFWCSPCYNELDEKIPIELADMTIMKADLKKKKNDEVHEESWVQCDECERWVHQICGLFNTRQNKEHHSKYCCPGCLCESRKKKGDFTSPKPPGASELPRTTLSEWLEQHICKRIEKRKRELAQEKVESENITLEEATEQVETGGPIIIRQVTSMERKLEVRELMKKRYAHKNYPDEFPFRCKCIVVFQRLDGVDVVLFALYVYEHGENNPPPNQRVVYISYLDSVHFMRPRRLRTFVYHEILIAYLDYARRRGFATAHIWACPPLKGDDYIFFAKPEDQKTPRDNRLRQWYIDMLVECQKRNIVGKVTNMYDVYFSDDSLDATVVPYLEGDYFPGEAENIIKMLQEGHGKKGGKGGKKKNKGTKNKGNTGTRSTGVDEEALLASGLLDGAKTLKDLDRDQVMVKMGETIQPMKESFIVAFLNWTGAKEADMVVSEEIEKARVEYAAEGDHDLVGSKRDARGDLRDSLMSKLDKDGQPVKVIDDDAEDLDCEFLNNRQAFLNLCRGNHYQFDELRRSKHTSMMVLWHLHNRDAPKFVQQCVACNREILSGKRYHCNTCPEYDLCQECYKNPETNRGNCTHKLVPIAVESDTSQERSGLTDAERQQRQRNLMMHIQLIEHASGCVSKSCSSSNCAKMKNYLHHASICRIKVQGGCKICKRIWTLLRIHAQKCKKAKCPIPQCNAIREKMRQLQKQQQAMDDRRRLEMNRHMRFSMAGGGGR